jgi:hypothetical protein
MNRSHALLLSLQPGLGRTTLVRYVAHLSKMKVCAKTFIHSLNFKSASLCLFKYFESRVSFDQKQNEKNFKMTLKQCCVLSGVKKSHCIIYIKADFISHEMLENILLFIRTGEPSVQCGL